MKTPAKTTWQLQTEIYEILVNQDYKIFLATLNKHFPKAKGRLSKLELNELEKLLPLLKEAYGRHV